MAIFLLLYVVFVLAWATWAAVLLWHCYKYHFPNDKELKLVLIVFSGASILILFISIVLLARADWTTVPTLMKGL